MPRVSVIVATYNRHRRLMQALESVRAQTWANLEVIVVNDGSTDPEYAAARPDDVVWIDLPANTRQTHGYPCLGHVRNVGVARSTGEYLAFLDDDDVWLPEKTGRQMSAMLEEGARMCCSEAYAADGPPSPDLLYPCYDRDIVGIHLPRHLTAEHVERENYITHSSVIMQRSLFDEAGPYLEIALHGQEVNGRLLVEDWELWRACLARTRCRYIAEPLCYYDFRRGKLRRPGNRIRIAALRVLRALFGRPQLIPVRY